MLARRHLRPGTRLLDVACGSGALCIQAAKAGAAVTGIDFAPNLLDEDRSRAGGMDIAVPIPGTWVTGDFEAGDVLIFQDVTVHKALPNRTRSIRMSFDARYQKLSEPMADMNLMPYAGCGS
ncbi:MAG: methyltransferase domain-containing protein [Acetobacteraceae bacterium]